MINLNTNKCEARQAVVGVLAVTLGIVSGLWLIDLKVGYDKKILLYLDLDLDNSQVNTDQKVRY